MLFDRAAKGKKSKELKGELKDLKKSLLNAGGEKAYVNEALRDYQAALEQGENAMAEAVAEKNGQVCVATATGGLTLWERDYGLPVREGAAMEDRRAAVRAAMLGGRTLTPAFLKELCVTLGGGDRGEVEEDFAHWSVTALTVGEGRVPADVPALKRAVERLKPAHLSVAVLPTADLTAHRWEAVTGGVMMEVWG